MRTRESSPYLTNLCIPPFKANYLLDTNFTNIRETSVFFSFESISSFPKFSLKKVFQKSFFCERHGRGQGAIFRRQNQDLFSGKKNI